MLVLLLTKQGPKLVLNTNRHGIKSILAVWLDIESCAKTMS